MGGILDKMIDTNNVNKEELEFFLNKIVSSKNVPRDIKSRKDGISITIDLVMESIRLLKEREREKENVSPLDIDYIIKTLNSVIVNINPIFEAYSKIVDTVNFEELRRKDAWDQLREKCENDIQYKQLWKELVLLLKLES